MQVSATWIIVQEYFKSARFWEGWLGFIQTLGGHAQDHQYNNRTPSYGASTFTFRGFIDEVVRLEILA